MLAMLFVCIELDKAAEAIVLFSLSSNPPLFLYLLRQFPLLYLYYMHCLCVCVYVVYGYVAFAVFSLFLAVSPLRSACSGSIQKRYFFLLPMPMIELYNNFPHIESNRLSLVFCVALGVNEVHIFRFVANELWRRERVAVKHCHT